MWGHRDAKICHKENHCIRIMVELGSWTQTELSSWIPKAALPYPIVKPRSSWQVTTWFIICKLVDRYEAAEHATSW
jgi:hypothetical protein